MTGSSNRDGRRQTMTVAAAIAQVALPTLVAPRWSAGFEPPDIMQPAPATFAVWLPIFAGSLAHAALQATPSRAADPTLRRVGGAATAAYTATAAWAPLVATGRYWSAQTALFVVAGAAETARRRLDQAHGHAEFPDTTVRSVGVPLGMLAAWGAAASVVNLASMLAANEAITPGRPARATAIAFTLATTGLAIATTATSPGGPRTASSRAYLSTVAWALGGIAVGQRRRSTTVAASAAAGATAVIAALARNARSELHGARPYSPIAAMSPSGEEVMAQCEIAVGDGQALGDPGRGSASRREMDADSHRFYERHGFVPVASTDGSGNEEQAPDRRYGWSI